MSIDRQVTGNDCEANGDDRELERMLAFYYECAKQSAVDARPNHEEHELARKFPGLLPPAIARRFTLH